MPSKYGPTLSRAFALLLLILVECACSSAGTMKNRASLRLSDLVAGIEIDFFGKPQISSAPVLGRDFSLLKNEIRGNPARLIHAYSFDLEPCVAWKEVVQEFENSGYRMAPLGLPTEHGMPEDAPSFTKSSKAGSLRANLFFKRDSSAKLCLSSIYVASA